MSGCNIKHVLKTKSSNNSPQATAFGPDGGLSVASDRKARLQQQPFACPRQRQLRCPLLPGCQQQPCPQGRPSAHASIVKPEANSAINQKPNEAAAAARTACSNQWHWKPTGHSYFGTGEWEQGGGNKLLRERVGNIGVIACCLLRSTSEPDPAPPCPTRTRCTGQLNFDSA